MEHAPDPPLISQYDPELGEVAAFEELIGSHGGLGGHQTEPFILHPTRGSSTSRCLSGRRRAAGTCDDGSRNRIPSVHRPPRAGSGGAPQGVGHGAGGAPVSSPGMQADAHAGSPARRGTGTLWRSHGARRQWRREWDSVPRGT